MVSHLTPAQSAMIGMALIIVILTVSLLIVKINSAQYIRDLQIKLRRIETSMNKSQPKTAPGEGWGRAQKRKRRYCATYHRYWWH